EAERPEALSRQGHGHGRSEGDVRRGGDRRPVVPVEREPRQPARAALSEGIAALDDHRRRNTRFVKNGAAAKLSDLAAKDRLVVLSKASRCALKSTTDPASLPALTARMVVDQGPAESS